MIYHFTRPVLTSLLAVAASSSIALAHVTVAPGDSFTGATVTYTVRVPTETESATVRIEIGFPATLTASAFEANPGWSATFESDPSGHITRAVISGGSIEPRESSDFSFACSNPAEAGELVWQIRQVYADGNSSDWTPATTVIGRE